MALSPLAKSDPGLQLLLEGVIRRQVRSILVDPYANAFTREPTDVSPWEADHTEMRPLVYERKWEIDSLCHAVRPGLWVLEGNRRSAPY